MDINKELLQFYVYKKTIKKKQSEKILEDCKRLNVSVREYMLAKEYTTDVRELPVLGDFYCMPYCLCQCRWSRHWSHHLHLRAA